MDNVDITYFLENPKGRCLPSHILNHFPLLYNALLHTKGTSSAERIYNFYNPGANDKCVVCGNPTKFKSLKEGYRRTCCTKCATSDPDRVVKAKATKLEKYGDENYNNRDKYKNTRGDRKWGFADPATHSKIRDIYGTDNVSKLDDIKTKKKQTFNKNHQTEESRKNITTKTKSTKRKKYGDENYNNRSQAKQTTQKRYGVDNIFRLKSVWQKGYEKRIINGVCYKNLGLANIAKAIERHDDVINCENGIYTCKCPHPECTKCSNHTFEINVANYHGRKNCGAELCTILNPIGKHCKNTCVELWVKQILDDCNIEYIRCNRQILSGRELDFYIPSKKLAIECNGVYWHSSEYKSSNYHINKFNDCANMGIQLITIWEDQVQNYPELLKNIILSKLGVYSKRIYARSCNIREISKQEADGILRYHIQGTGQSTIRYGLFHNNELVSVMTFAKRRVFVGGTGDEYELIRFCNLPGVQVVGGASKLLKKFLREYNNPALVSYSSNDISSGSLYEALGFNKTKQSKSYWYIEPNTFKRFHRFNFRKDILVKKGYDKNLSESQITKQLGLLRINDAGQTRWELNFQ